MTFTIDGYEVEIKAKGFGKDRFNKNDTMAFANHLSLILSEAGASYKYKGLHNIAARCDGDVDNIYNQLDALGYYDDCKRG